MTYKTRTYKEKWELNLIEEDTKNQPSLGNHWIFVKRWGFGSIIKEYHQFPFSYNRKASSSLGDASRYSFWSFPFFACFCFILASLFSLGKELLSSHFYLAACHETKLSLVSESKVMQCFSLHFAKAFVPRSQHCTHWTLNGSKGSQNHGRLRNGRLKGLRLSGWRSQWPKVSNSCTRRKLKKNKEL